MHDEVRVLVPFKVARADGACEVLHVQRLEVLVRLVFPGATTRGIRGASKETHSQRRVARNTDRFDYIQDRLGQVRLS